MTLQHAAHAVLVEKGRITYQGPAADAPPLVLPSSLSSSSLAAAAAAMAPAVVADDADADGDADVDVGSQAAEEERDGDEEDEDEDEAAALLKQYGGSSSIHHATGNGHARPHAAGARGRITQDEAAVSAAAAAASAVAAAVDDGDGGGWVRRRLRRLRAGFGAYEVSKGGW